MVVPGGNTSYIRKSHISEKSNERGTLDRKYNMTNIAWSTHLILYCVHVLIPNKIVQCIHLICDSDFDLELYR